MPGPAMTCVDCQINAGIIEARKRSLCRDCFLRYIRSKPIKRIESYHINDRSSSPIKVLVPLSGGVSSVVLLQILDWHMQRQVSKRGHAPFVLCVVMVDLSTKDERPTTDIFDQLKARFPDHSFTLRKLSDVLELDDTIFDDYSSLGLEKLTDADESLHRFFSRASTSSARADLFSFLLTRLIVLSAKLQDCQTVMWGHSDSRLASQTLADVAKGRGGSSPYNLSDGPSPWALNFYYPLRDLLNSELVAYAKALNDNLLDLVVPDGTVSAMPVSVRAASMDQLLSNYINVQGEKYPSIVANVVRTASKLQAPPVSKGSTIIYCPVCRMPRSETTSLQLCYGCQRLKLELRTPKT